MFWILLNSALSLSLIVQGYLLKNDYAELNNPSMTPDGQILYDGDMLLSDDQLEFFYGNQSIELRKGVSVKSMLWPNGVVPYRFTSSANVYRKQIMEALQYWMDNTCITFKEITEPVDEPHVFFTKKTGCWSHVGRKFWENGQELSIGFGCEKKGKIAHEVGHAIGFHHEHARRDRDNHIKLFPENYDSNKKENFKKQTVINNYQIPYDYDSIMHYSMYAFSNNEKKTIAPLDPTKQFLLGQRDHLSFYDLKLANTMYNCNEGCDNKVCMNEGFLTSSCKCYCKEGYTGEFCEEESPIKNACGGYVHSEKTITSPNYPQFYPPDTQCVWWVKAPEGKNAQVYFEDFDLRRREEDTKDCYFDKVEVRTEDIYEGKIYCGEELKGKTLKSKDNSLVVVFETDSRLNRGFKIQVKFI